MATEQEQQRVADAIKRLPTRLRKPFVMAHVQRKSRAEIAAALHISERRVDRRLIRALVVCQGNLERGPTRALTVLRWAAAPFVLLLVFLVHLAYVVVVRICALLGLRPPRPWLR